jgi:biotin synthase-like enzyme
MIIWACKYCGQSQKTKDLPQSNADTHKYSDVIKEAAKDGKIMCWSCYDSLRKK